MKKGIQCLLYAVVATMLFASSASALSMGTNITINDEVNGWSSWYGSDANTSVGREDNEVETTCTEGQAWDLEAFFLDGYTLSMVGGYDFINGNEGFTSGDIFIDINGNAQFGTANEGSNICSYDYAIVPNTFGYDYAIDLVFDQGGYYYNVYLLDGSSTVNVYYSLNDESNPWSYVIDPSSLVGSGKLTYLQSLSDSEVGLQGGSHNVVQLDLSFLKANENFTGAFTTHFTMGCGNDNLMGAAPVPEPATLLLLGSGLLGLAGFRRKTK